MSAKFVSNFKGNRFDFSELTGIYKQ
jgi:hypothetical protein